MYWPLRFGVFYAPFHPPGQSPTLALEYDLERAVALDRLGYDEVWFGEHHSGGYEIIASPELMIAFAAERTRNIKLGTGVVSLPYHHPLILADRMVQLDHLTRGRAIFGVGPGALPTDAYMMGIDPVTQRPRMEESLEAMLALFDGSEPVNRETDWFTLKEAQLQVRPYSHPRMEVAAAAMFSPSGPRVAGKYGVSLLSLSALSAQGYASLGSAWDIVEEQAAKSGGKEPDRRNWRLVGPMHIAETKERAEKEVEWGLSKWLSYSGGGFAAGVRAPKEGESLVESAGLRNVVGTPQTAIDRIERIIDKSGGFGTFLFLGHDWADHDATLRCYELIAREVIPHFQGQLVPAQRSNKWMSEKGPAMQGRVGEAIMAEVRSHAAEQKQSAPAN